MSSLVEEASRKSLPIPIQICMFSLLTSLLPPLKTQKPSAWNDFIMHARISIPAAYYSTFCDDVTTLERYVPDSQLVSSCSLVCVIRRTFDFASTAIYHDVGRLARPGPRSDATFKQRCSHFSLVRGQRGKAVGSIWSLDFEAQNSILKARGC